MLCTQSNIALERKFLEWSSVKGTIWYLDNVLYTSCYLDVHMGWCWMGGSDSEIIEEAADNTGSESDSNLKMFHTTLTNWL